MTLTKQQMRDFAKYARSPETWLSSARRHLAVAKVLMDRTAALRFSSDKIDEFSGCFYAWYLHAGLAVENAVKAVLIVKDPNIVKLNGSLDIKKFGKKQHSIRELVRSVLSELSESEEQLLMKLEEHVVWAGKYTVPIRADVLYNQSLMNVARTSSVLDELALVESIVDLVDRLFEQIAP